MFQIDTHSKTPVYEQLIKQTEDFVLKEILGPNDKIPSVRNLSATLSINPNTIQKAYSELDRRGIIYSVPGKGCFICDNAKNLISAKKLDNLNELELIVKDLCLAGIPKNKIIECIDNIYNQSKH